MIFPLLYHILIEYPEVGHSLENSGFCGDVGDSIWDDVGGTDNEEEPRESVECVGNTTTGLLGSDDDEECRCDKRCCDKRCCDEEVILSSCNGSILFME